MSSITLAAKRLITTTEVVDRPLLRLEDGRIVSIASQNDTEATQITHDLSSHTLSAGFLDVHVHGAANHDVMQNDAQSLDVVSKYLATRGVSQYLATTVTAAIEPTLDALSRIADAIEADPSDKASRIAGIHLEGPFVSHAKRGVHPTEFIVPPSVELFDHFWQASRGHIRLMTIAPELPNALDVIRRAVALGVRVSLGHSNATKAETDAAVALEAASATHTYNAMRPLDHREPGILGVVLSNENLFAELICDGVHTTPEMVKIWLRCKGADRAILVTDGMAAMGMPDGQYMLGSFEVTVKDGVCLSHGALAGSVLTMDKAVANVQKFTGTDLATAVRMASANPAAMLGIDHRVAEGAEASFNLFDENGAHAGVMLRGEML